MPSPPFPYSKKTNAMKVTVIVEKASDGRYACYMEDEFEHFGLAGYGDTVEEAKRDLDVCYFEMKELEAEQGRSIPALEYVYKYDMQSFFNCFPFLNVSKVAERAGINPTLMRQYTCGAARAGQKQYEKLRRAVRGITAELQAATF